MTAAVATAEIMDSTYTGLPDPVQELVGGIYSANDAAELLAFGVNNGLVANSQELGANMARLANVPSPDQGRFH